MIYKGTNGGFFLLRKVSDSSKNDLNEIITESLLFIWIKNNGTQISIDGTEYVFAKDQLLFLTQSHNVVFIIPDDCIVMKFNRLFFDVLEDEVAKESKGLLFASALPFPIISVSKNELNQFQTIWQLAMIENTKVDLNQIMIQQLLLLSRELYIEQNNLKSISKKALKIIQDFSFLVEENFKEKHLVSDYARMMKKSSKTLSNSFAENFQKSPLQIIQNRILLESKRLLLFGNNSVQTIAQELGFIDVATFSRFFRNKMEVTPSEFRKQKKVLL